MSYIKKMIERDKNARVTVGCRCAFGENSNWAKNWFEAGRHCIIEERSNGSFGVLVLSKGFTGKLAKNLSIYDNSVAWVDEDELELVDRNYSANLDFLDWFQEVKEDICGTCRKAFYDHKKEKCPNPDCLSNN